MWTEDQCSYASMHYLVSHIGRKIVLLCTRNLGTKITLYYVGNICAIWKSQVNSRAGGVTSQVTLFSQPS
jgi:hypothetical protein